MKSISFKANRTSPKATAEQLCAQVVNFLTKNGMSRASAKEMVYVDQGMVCIMPRCANNDFTRALSLLQLIFSSSEAPGFISYNTHVVGVIILNGFRGDNYAEMIEWIEEHNDISIS